MLKGRRIIVILAITPNAQELGVWAESFREKCFAALSAWIQS